MTTNGLSTIDFVVTGEAKLHCAGCENRVSDVLGKVVGVESVDASAETQHINVAFDTRRVSAEQIRARLEQMGYHVEANGEGILESSDASAEPNRAVARLPTPVVAGLSTEPPSPTEGLTDTQRDTGSKPTAGPGDPRRANQQQDDSIPSERRLDLRSSQLAENDDSRTDANPTRPRQDDAGRQSGLDKLQIKIGGIECSFCVGTITKALTRMEGAHDLSVNMAHEEALIHYDPARVTPTALKETLRELGYTVRDIGKERTFEEQEAELRAERNNLFLAAAFAAIAANFMVLMWFDLLTMEGATVVIGSGQRVLPFMIWLAPTLALATMFGPGWRFLNIAWASLKRGILNQHVLMEFGACAGLLGGFLAFVVPFEQSPWSRLLGVDYPVLFDFFGVVVFINTYHILSAYVSLVVRTRASQAVRKLLDLVPPTAYVVRDGREVSVPVEEVQRGELIRVRPGESIPLDGEVVEGASGVDESLVTGESIPQEKTAGDEVIGGSLVQAGTLLIRVTKVGAEGFVQQVARQVEEARALKPGVMILVDRVLKVFVPGVLGFAAAAFLIWTVGAAIFGGGPFWTTALLATLAVLVMGYPCALGMATPLAMIRGGGMAAERGILMRSGEAFQILKEVRKVVLDKTGTMTRGQPAVVEAIALGDHDTHEVIRFAAAAEVASEHPLGRAIVSAAEQLELSIPAAQDFQNTPGKGVRAEVQSCQVLVGKPRFLEEEHVDLAAARSQIDELQEAGNTVVALAVDGQPAGLIAIADQIKPDAKEAIDRMRQVGLEPVMLTGDNERTARAVARQVGITEYRAEVLPQDKADAVRELQRQGHRVAMVGDGINDAPALMQADVGIAIGAGTDIAIESADVVLIGDRLSAVMDAYEIGKESYKKTVQNLVLAFSFNGIGVPLAVTGLVHPVWAMIAMAASVTTVLANSFGGRLLKSASENRPTAIAPSSS